MNIAFRILDRGSTSLPIHEMDSPFHRGSIHVLCKADFQRLNGCLDDDTRDFALSA